MKIQEFNYSINILQSLLWQYDKADVIKILLQEKQNWYAINQEQFWQDWYRDVFDLRTADEFGLSVWSFILDQPLQIGAGPDPEGKPIFGFGAETGDPFSNGYVNFDRGNFANAENALNLSTEEKRIIIFLKYYKCVGNCALEDANPFLDYVFKDYPGRGNNKVYLLDGLDMRQRIVFNFAISNSLKVALQTFDLIPRQTGVKLEWVIYNGPLFGFGAETGDPFSNGYVNFENGSLFGGYE